MVTLMNIFVPLRPDYVASSHFLPLYDASTYEWLAGIRSSYLITTEQRISAGFCCCSAASRVSRIGNTEYKLGDALLSDDETPAWQSSASWRGQQQRSRGFSTGFDSHSSLEFIAGARKPAEKPESRTQKPIRQAGRQATPCHWELFVLHYSRALPHGEAESTQWGERLRLMGRGKLFGKTQEN